MYFWYGTKSYLITDELNFFWGKSSQEYPPLVHCFCVHCCYWSFMSERWQKKYWRLDLFCTLVVHIWHMKWISDPLDWAKFKKRGFIEFKTVKLFLLCLYVFYIGQWWQSSRGTLTLSEDLFAFLPHLHSFWKRKAAVHLRVMRESWRNYEYQIISFIIYVKHKEYKLYWGHKVIWYGPASTST